MNTLFKKSLNSTKNKLFVSLAGLCILLVVGVAIASSVKNTNQSAVSHIAQDISKARVENPLDYSLTVEQDSDALLKILDTKVKVVSPSQYETLTSERTGLREVVSVPEINLQNVSDKTIVSITVIINDKSAKTNRGLYIKEQSIKPGQNFSILQENFVKTDSNPAANPKFWLSTKDKSQVVIRVGATFEDGSTWFNKNYGGAQ